MGQHCPPGWGYIDAQTYFLSSDLLGKCDEYYKEGEKMREQQFVPDKGNKITSETIALEQNLESKMEVHQT